MKTKLFFFIFLILQCTCIFSQYRIPFGSKGNIIELSINNFVESNTSTYNIITSDLPEWLEFSNNNFEIKDLKYGESKVLTFKFNVNNSAPVNEKYSIPFKVIDHSGKTVNKFIDIIVGPPDKFELIQNYPNPFNPSTTISFIVPEKSFVNLSVINILGETVETLVNEEKLPGFYQENFNAIDLSSGVYFFTLKSNNYIQTKKMILLK